MPCLIAIVAILSPRLALFLLLIFTDMVETAFHPWWYSIIGWLFLPWTTLAWTVCYQPFLGVNGFGWFIVALGFLFDVMSWAGSRRISDR